MPSLRKCDQCQVKLPPFKPRNRLWDGSLVCDGCHPDKPGQPGRPIDVHAAKEPSLRCDACSAPMGDAGMVVTAGKITCADGCKTASDDSEFYCAKCGELVLPSDDTTCPEGGEHERPDEDDHHTASLTKQAHDSGDGATIYHCPFCGAGQVTARSDGTVECGFCHNNFTVQVQPAHAAMPQTDPTTGQPLNMPGMPGDPATHVAPTPTPMPEEPNFAPEGTGGEQGFAPAGTAGAQFLPAGSGNHAQPQRAASRRTATGEPFQEAVLQGLMGGRYDYINPGAMLPSPVYVVLQPGPHGAIPTDRKTTDRDEANRWAQELLDQYPTGFPHSASLQTTAWDKEEWDERHDPDHEDCTTCGGSGELSNGKECEDCDASGIEPNRRKASKTAMVIPGFCTSCHRVTQVRVKGFNPSQGAMQTGTCRRCEDKADQKRQSALYLTPDGVAIPEKSYLAHLALRFADDRDAVLTAVRSERTIR